MHYPSWENILPSWILTLTWTNLTDCALFWFSQKQSRENYALFTCTAAHTKPHIAAAQ